MKQTHANYSLIVLIFILVVFGLAMLASASSVAGFTSQYHDSYYFLKHQLLYGLLPGVILFIFLARADWRLWQKKSRWLLLASLVLLVLVLIPQVGVELHGSRSWLNLGPFSLQPSEIAKLMLLIYLAARLSNGSDQLRHFFSGLLPLIFIIGLMAGLVALQPDFGTMSIIILIGLGVCFVAGLRWRHLIFLTVSGSLLFWAILKKMPQKFERLQVFLNPEIEPLGIGYHLKQALIAIGTGGIFGMGLGRSRQKFQYLPEVSGDSIFAIMAEELGFILTLVFIVLILALVFKLIRLAQANSHGFARLYLVGLALWIGGQSLVNIGAMLGLMPLTGVPLPFVSYGGTALMTLLAACGLAVRLAREA
jgi:cell division protein FtsW